MQQTATELASKLNDSDSHAHESHEVNDAVHVVVMESDIGSVFKFAREKGLETDLFRGTYNDRPALRGWLS